MYSSGTNGLRAWSHIRAAGCRNFTLENEHLTLGFDATTQEGTHITDVHFTTKTKALSASVDQLPGGTAEDYANHICVTVNKLAIEHIHIL